MSNNAYPSEYDMVQKINILITRMNVHSDDQKTKQVLGMLFNAVHTDVRTLSHVIHSELLRTPK